MTIDPTWLDPTASWNAKAGRASEHAESLRRLITDFLDSRPFALTPEPTEQPERIAYRLRCHRDVPISVSTTVGDVLHNLRSALDSLAFELARRSRGGSLSVEQERLPYFPICVSPDDFDHRFVSDKRASLYDDRELEALRAAQWFVTAERNQAVGVSLESYEDGFRWSLLRRLDKLWNVDKHRRLMLTAGWPGTVFWRSHGRSNRRRLPGDDTMEDGSVAFYVEGTDEGMGNEIAYGFNVRFKYDPALDDAPDYTHDVLTEMEELHRHVVHDVFPRVFAVMSSPP